MAESRGSSDVVIVGGGIAGLTAATYLARGGLSVTLYEKAADLGGRARTQSRNGYRFNLGPHALYKKGDGMRVLRDLGIRVAGNIPNAGGGFAVRDGRKHTLPGGFVSLLSTGLMGLAGKLETAKLLAGIGKIDPKPLQRVTVDEWLGKSIRDPDVRALLRALFRLTTYTHAPQRQSAGLAVEQLQLALDGNVLYLDNGWQTLVDALREKATHAGATLVSGVRVGSVAHDDRVRGVTLADGTQHAAAAVILALAPAEAASLVPHSALLRAWSESRISIDAACLDIALSRLPDPKATFALGIDCPLYLSVHSAVANLAPQGGAVIQVAKYLEPQGDDDPSLVREELEGLLDLIQPGWRDVLVEHRFLPKMTVCQSLVTAAMGGNSGRPGPSVAGIDQLFLAGDWIGNRGFLADGSFASAEKAAELILRGRQASANAA